MYRDALWESVVSLRGSRKGSLKEVTFAQGLRDVENPQSEKVQKL